MTTLEHPGTDFPAGPRVTIEVPDDWDAVPVAGTVLAARQHDDGRDSFLPNVVVRVDRRSSATGLDEALGEVRRYVADKPRGEASEPFRSDFGGRRWVGCNVSWVEPGAGTVLQAHLFTLLPAGDLQDLVQVTGSVGGDRAQEDYPLIKKVIQQVTVAPEGQGTGGTDQ